MRDWLWELAIIICLAALVLFAAMTPDFEIRFSFGKWLLLGLSATMLLACLGYLEWKRPAPAQVNRDQKGGDNPMDNGFPVEEKEMDELIDEAMDEVEERSGRRGLRPGVEASTLEHLRATVKARLVAKLKLMAEKGDMRVMKVQLDRVRLKKELVQELCELTGQSKELAYVGEEKELEHQVKLEGLRYDLEKAKLKREALRKPAEVIEAVDEDKRLFEEIQKVVGRKVKRELFKQEVKSKALEEMFKELRKRIAEIEESDLQQPDKERLIGELKKNFEYTIKRMEEGEQ